MTGAKRTRLAPLRATKGLEFDEESHVYSVGGKQLPSVTQIIEGAGLCDTRFYTPESRIRGTIVHQAIDLLGRGELDWGKLHPDYHGYVESYEDFVRAVGFRAAGMEVRLAHVPRGFAGTLDLFGVMDHGASGNWLIDLKTGGAAEWHNVQLAGYEMLLGAAGREVKQRGVLYLDEKGGHPKLVIDPAPKDNDTIWNAALILHPLRKPQGRKGSEDGGRSTVREDDPF